MRYEVEGGGEGDGSWMDRGWDRIQVDGYVVWLGLVCMVFTKIREKSTRNNSEKEGKEEI